MARAEDAGAEARDVCVEGGLQASEGTLAFTLGEVATHTWSALNRGET